MLGHVGKAFDELENPGEKENALDVNAVSVRLPTRLATDFGFILKMTEATVELSTMSDIEFECWCIWYVGELRDPPCKKNVRRVIRSSIVMIWKRTQATYDMFTRTIM